MKTDLYTKVVLTVITVALTINVLKDFDVIPSAQASQPTPSVADIQRTNEVVDVRITGVSGFTTIPVEIKKVDNTIPVKIEEVSTFRTIMPVRIEEVNSSTTIPVKVK